MKGDDGDADKGTISSHHLLGGLLSSVLFSGAGVMGLRQQTGAVSLMFYARPGGEESLLASIQRSGLPFGGPFTPCPQWREAPKRGAGGEGGGVVGVERLNAKSQTELEDMFDQYGDVRAPADVSTCFRFVGSGGFRGACCCSGQHPALKQVSIVHVL